MRQNRYIDLEKKQEALMKEMDELFSTYMIEMKDENEKFLQELQSINLNRKLPENSSPSIEKKLKMENKQPNMQDNSRKDESPYPKGTVFQAVKAYSNSKKIQPKTFQDSSSQTHVTSEKEPQAQVPAKNEQGDSMESMLKKAQDMQKQGLSIEDIAKRLDRGKTEIELLLKFHQNHQE